MDMWDLRVSRVALVWLVCAWCCTGLGLRLKDEVLYEAWEASESALELEDPNIAASASSRIVNGMTATDVNQFPSVVSLLLQDGDNSPYLFCTGAMIDSNVVLSAAHCVVGMQPAELVVCAGDVDLYDRPPTNCARANAIVVPGEYDIDTNWLTLDLAVISLEGSLLKGKVSTVATTFKVPGADQAAFSVGYGLSTQNEYDPIDGKLHYLDERVVPSEDCQLLQWLAAESYEFNAEDLVCAYGNHDDSRGTTCFGDSGGPLLVVTDDRATDYVIGVVSFGLSSGREACISDFETGYASLTSQTHKNFIEDAVQELGGTIRTVSPTVVDSKSTCNVPAVEQCMVAINDPCLDDNPDEECCTNAYHANDCLEALIGPCRGTQVARDFQARTALFEAGCADFVVRLTPTATASFPGGLFEPSPDSSTSPSPSLFPAQDPSQACFSAEATVIVDVGGERTSRAMRDLQIGDRVQTGRDSFSEVFAFTHRIERVQSSFVRVVAGDAAVEMSPTHYIPVHGRGLVAASHLRVGDMLHLGSGKTAMVQSVSRVTRRGLYNPQTMDDVIVVDGVIASTFTQTVHPQVARWLLLVPKLAYRLGVFEPLGRWFYATAPQPVLWLVPQGSPELMRS